MNSKTSTRALILAGMMFAANAYAGAEINKCVSASGSVTLTDEVCPSGAQTVKLVSASVGSTADESTPAGAPRTSVERYAATRLPARNTTPMRSVQAARGLSLDIATLKAARMNMQLVDNAAQSMRTAQRVAGLQ